MKKLVLILTIFFFQLVIGIQSVSAFYSDIQTDYKYYTGIKTLYDKNKLPEFTDNQFHPDDKATTDDLNTLLKFYLGQETGNKSSKKPLSKLSALSTIFNTLGIQLDAKINTDTFLFKDIKPTSKNANIAAKSIELGIFEKDKNIFRAGKRITKGEAAYYLYKVYSAPNPSNTTNDKYSQELINNPEFLKLVDVWKILKSDFLYKDKLNDKDLITEAIKGMVESAKDQYTIFEQPTEAKEFLKHLSDNIYEGVGMQVDLIDNSIRVVSPLDNSPAEKAGIKPNDIITEIDGTSVIGMTLDEVAAKIKGLAGTTVKIKVLRDKSEITFEMKREKITQKSIQYKTLDKNNKKIGYIKINTFGTNTYQDFMDAAKSILKESPRGFIIDLRNDPGGYMDTATLIAGLFTKDIKIALNLKSGNGTENKVMTDGNGLLSGYKIAVLINGGSASSSEILAGALKDYGVATLIGEKSFGKGTVQQLEEYQDGSIFKYTIQQWFTPNGTDINGKGISPDIIETNKEQQLIKAEELF
ncbi:S41 family peptidase [Candidatus Peregrinibacteria bacterium]|nr:S41 family peptidase [Candidatus Peregrinibacteria bacterium]